MNKKILSKPVDIYNQFWYDNNRFEIDRSLEQYKVHNPPEKDSNGYWNNWTNECEMDAVIIIQENDVVRFLDMKSQDITNAVRQV